ncbi:MAG: hypothetical protein GYA41_07160 [Bacteroidales bacterium]|nr:hypothetical protein [Bacteroidales bacterium]
MKEMLVSGKYLKWLLILWLFTLVNKVAGQPAYDYSKPFMATTQFGFRISGEKNVILVPGDGKERLPDTIPFYITNIGGRLSRDNGVPDLWKNTIFRWPFDIMQGKYLAWDKSKPPYLYSGKLVKKITRWGIFYFGDFTEFRTEGFYQMESVYGNTVPFMIGDHIYDRLDRGYLEFMYCQRSGMEIPGIRPVENADDGRLMSDPNYYLPVAGGWNDAGDWRKWIFLTIGNLESLMNIYTDGHPAFRQQALDEIRWGNAYFHNMVSDSGFVFEDTGGGFNRAAGMDEEWWNENHSGVTAGGDTESDNIPMNGNERRVRDQHNPLCQYQYVRYQALCSSILPPPDQSNCRILAERAWKYGQKHPHDGRTLFLAEELLAAAELINAGSKSVSIAKLSSLIADMLERQEIHTSGLSGYFMEKDHTDGYRSIAFPSEPAAALLRVLELKLPDMEKYRDRIEKSVKEYVDGFVIKDAENNPFSLPPYGIYVNPPFPKKQLFREAGNGRYVRTFGAVFNSRPMPHGVNANFIAQANLVSRAAIYFSRPDWIDFAEGILSWSTGYNTTGLCLFTGVGFKHPVPANYMNYKIPSSVPVGFLGRPDDSPYMETSNAVEWSTQEAWDVPYYNTVQMIRNIRTFYKNK